MAKRVKLTKQDKTAIARLGPKYKPQAVVNESQYRQLLREYTGEASVLRAKEVVREVEEV